MLQDRGATSEGADGAAGEPGMARKQEHQLGESIAVADDGGVGVGVRGERGGGQRRARAAAGGGDRVGDGVARGDAAGAAPRRRLRR